MWPSVRRWLDSAMTDLLAPTRPRPTDQPVHLRYEKAGLTLPGPPLPWNADAVVVEVLVQLPPAARVRADFTLRLPGLAPVPAEAVRKDGDGGTRHRVLFRLPVPAGPTTAATSTAMPAYQPTVWRNREASRALPTGSPSRVPSAAHTSRPASWLAHCCTTTPAPSSKNTCRASRLP